MLVGQDWGNSDKKYNKEVIENIKNGRKHFDGVKSGFKTDKNLFELFKAFKKDDKVLFEDIETKKYDSLFFTNFCLGYRCGNSTVGMTKKQMLLDEKYFLKLIDIVKPKIIICLGKMTYECVIGTLLKEKKYLCNDFYAKLNNGENFETVKGIAVFGVAHCGSYGERNRKNNAPKNSTAKGIDLMTEDWKRINDYINNNKIEIGGKNE